MSLRRSVIICSTIALLVYLLTQAILHNMSMSGAQAFRDTAEELTSDSSLKLGIGNIYAWVNEMPRISLPGEDTSKHNLAMISLTLQGTFIPPALREAVSSPDSKSSSPIRLHMYRVASTPSDNSSVVVDDHFTWTGSSIKITRTDSGYELGAWEGPRWTVGNRGGQAKYFAVVELGGGLKLRSKVETLHVAL